MITKKGRAFCLRFDSCEEKKSLSQRSIRDLYPLGGVGFSNVTVLCLHFGLYKRALQNQRYLNNQQT